MRSTVFSVSLLVVLGIAASAAADAASDKKEAQARAQFEQGLELFEKGRFEQAAIAFERAYELKPSYKILYNLGQAEHELEHYAAALKAYSRYLAEGGDEVPEERVKEVKYKIKKLNNLVGMIIVECPVEQALVKVDDEVVGKTPLLGPIFVDIGKHRVTVKKGKEELLNQVLKVAGGERVVAQVETGEAAVTASAEEAEEAEEEPIEEEPEPEPTEEEPGDRPDRLWTWVALGVGGAAGIAGGVIGGMALSRKNRLMDECGDGTCPDSREDERDRIKTMALTADILYGVAGAAVVVGVVLFFVEPKLGHESQETALRVAPTTMADGAGVVLEGRF
jgi:hypothetical protein